MPMGETHLVEQNKGSARKGSEKEKMAGYVKSERLYHSNVENFSRESGKVFILVFETLKSVTSGGG